ncbi:MAG TPA: YDG domain-containing protein, partial [Ilumatobacteraceae bacterium]|nr:YDG domain-containing protein [Ilumatobacteraceae bacterium]
YTGSTPGTCAIAGGLIRIVAAGVCTVTASQAGNASFQAAPAVTRSFAIAAKTLTGSFTTQSRTYDGTTSAEIATRSLDGIVGADAVALAGGTAAFADKNVGADKPVSGSGFALSGAAAANYALASTTIASTGTITAATVVVAFTAADKVYDGTAVAAIAGRSISGVLGEDAVSVGGGSATFEDPSAGAGKTVTATGFVLGGADAGNYAISSDPATVKASIARLEIDGAFTASGKIYDGSTAAEVLTRSLVGVLEGDEVELTGGAATFDDAGAGVDKTVTLTGAALAGADAGNYLLSSEPITAAATIARLGIAGAFTAADKVYDGGTAAEVLTRSVVGALDGDEVELTGGSAAFADANAGPGKTVSLSDATLTGAAAGNYSLTGVADATASITKKLLTVTGPSPAAIVYGDALPELEPGYEGFVAGEDAAMLALAPACELDPGYHGAGSYAVRCSGGEDGNYAFAYSDGALTVATKALTGSFTAADKEYDGTTAADAAPLPLAGLVDSDAVVLQVSDAAFAEKNAGPDKVVTADIALGGADAHNYYLTSDTATALASITKKLLTVTGPSPAAIVYGDALPDLDPGYEGFVAGEDADLLAQAPACELDPGYHGAGSYAVACSGGEDGNYEFAYETGALTVATKPLTGTFTAADKVYDGSAAADATPLPLAGLVGSDTVLLQVTNAAFEDRNAGSGKVVTADLALTGADAENYHLTVATATALAEITPLGLAVTGAQANARDYDGTADATVDFGAAGLVEPIAGDDVSLDSSAYTASFASKQAGAAKPVTVGGVTLAGADAGNYTVAQPTGLSAEIRRLATTGSFTTPASKVYDGGTNAAVLTRSAHGVVAGDAVALAGGSAAFDTKNVGTGTTVILTGAALTGADADNYTLASVAPASSDIVKAPLTVTAHDKQMILNGAVPALTATIVGYVAGESFGASSGVTGAPSCATADGTAPGSFEIACTAGTLTAANYSFAFVKGTLTVSYALSSCLGSPGHAILQPIDQDGSSVFKQGSTVPAKFRVCDARGVSIGAPGVVASFRLASTSAGVAGPIDEG